MADFKVPNLCGASPEFNAIQTKFDSLMSSVTDGLELDAGALTTTLDGDVNALVGDIKVMIPDLPALPDVNLQAELTSLSSLTTGSVQHTALLADITSKFGSELTAGGFSLETLVGVAALALGGGESLCSSVPNFTVPAAGGDAVQKAVGVKQAAADALPEKPSVLVENANLTSAKADAETEAKEWVNPDIETVPTEDTTRLSVTKKTTKITTSETTVEATTPSDAIASTTVSKEERSTEKTTTITESGGEVTVRKRSNTSEKGFTSRREYKTERFKLADVITGNFGTTDTYGVTGNFTRKLKLAHTPSEVKKVRGYAEKRRKGKTSISSAKIAAANRVGNNRVGFMDRYIIEGNEILITDIVDYIPKPGRKDIVFQVGYAYLVTYDPNYRRSP